MTLTYDRRECEPVCYHKAAGVKRVAMVHPDRTLFLHCSASTLTPSSSLRREAIWPHEMREPVLPHGLSKLRDDAPNLSPGHHPSTRPSIVSIAKGVSSRVSPHI